MKEKGSHTRRVVTQYYNVGKEEDRLRAVSELHQVIMISRNKKKA